MNKDEIAEVRATAKAMREEGYQIAAGTIDRAADALTTLSAENERLRTALKPFAEQQIPETVFGAARHYAIAFQWIRDARQALGDSNV